MVARTGVENGGAAAPGLSLSGTDEPFRMPMTRPGEPGPSAPALTGESAGRGPLAEAIRPPLAADPTGPKTPSSAASAPDKVSTSSLIAPGPGAAPRTPAEAVSPVQETLVGPGAGVSAPEPGGGSPFVASSRMAGGALPPQTTQGLALAIADSGDGRVELRLSPEELGTVKMQIRSTEHGLAVQIFAERGETDALIRRSLSDLGQELRDLGYRDVRFEFGNGGQGDRRATGGGAVRDGLGIGAPDAAPADPDPRPRRPVSGHLDIRI